MAERASVIYRGRNEGVLIRRLGWVKLDRHGFYEFAIEGIQERLRQYEQRAKGTR